MEELYALTYFEGGYEEFKSQPAKIYIAQLQTVH